MSSSTTGCVTDDHRHFISIMAIDRVKKSVPSSTITKSRCPRSENVSRYERHDEQRNIVRCKELHLCGGPGGDSRNVVGLENLENSEPVIKTRGTQTDYRESETQTIPWEAPYDISQRPNAKPEVLSLLRSTWGNGLPAGIHEVEIIRRMRIKRAWLDALPPMDCPENVKIRENITAAIEANEWAFREAEIQFIMDTRMELMNRIAKIKTEEREKKISKRIERYAERLSRTRDNQIRKIRANYSREMRKLNVKHRATSATMKNRNFDIITRYASAKSNFSTNEIKSNGTNEKNQECSKVAELKDKSNWLPVDQILMGANRNRFRQEELCPRESRWNDEKLRKLHDDLKSIRLKIRDKNEEGVPSLLKRRPKLPDLPITPTISANDGTISYWDNCSSFLQKITRGRAVQCMMYEGRNRCKELIEELRSTLQQSRQESEQTNGDEKINNSIVNLEDYDDDDDDDDVRENRVSEILDSLEGMTVSGMLDMLSKEDQRLREERRAHGFAMLAERERNRREAEESGRRQLERNRRRELDEMFRQIVKVNQDSVEVYLEDVIRDGIDWISSEQARQYVVELADKIDEDTSQNFVDDDSPHDEEFIGEMIRNCLLPEVDKKIMRQKIQSTKNSLMNEARLAINEEIVKSMEKLKISTDEGETMEKLFEKIDDTSMSEIKKSNE